jgi:HIV Tat-specific factor 1
MIQEPSVPLAIQLLDGTSFRPGGKTLMSVSVAEFQQRGKFHDLLKPHKLHKYITDVFASASGEVFVAKKADKQKKKKGKKVEDKMLGWGNFYLGLQVFLLRRI